MIQKIRSVSSDRLPNHKRKNQTCETKKREHKSNASALDLSAFAGVALGASACSTDEPQIAYGKEIKREDLDSLSSNLPTRLAIPSAAKNVRLFDSGDTEVPFMYDGDGIIFLHSGTSSYRVSYTSQKDQTIETVTIDQVGVKERLKEVELSTASDDKSFVAYLPSGNENLFYRLSIPDNQKKYTVRLNREGEDDADKGHLSMWDYNGEKSSLSDNVQQFLSAGDDSVAREYFIRLNADDDARYRVLFYEDDFGDFASTAESLSKGKDEEETGAINVARDKDWFNLGSLQEGSDYLFKVTDFNFATGNIKFVDANSAAVSFENYETQTVGDDVYISVSPKDTGSAYMVFEAKGGADVKALPGYTLQWIDDDYAPVVVDSTSTQTLSQSLFSAKEKPSSVTGNLEVEGDIDVIKIELEANTSYLLSATGMDIKLGIDDDETHTTTMPYNDKGRYKHTTEAATIYYLRVIDYVPTSGANSEKTGRYTINFTREDDVFADKDTLETVALGETKTGTIDNASDEDWFKMSVGTNAFERGKSYQVSLKNTVGLQNVTFRLTDASGNTTIASADGTLKFIMPDSTGVDHYYLEVAGSGASEGFYSFAVNALTPTKKDLAPSLTLGSKADIPSGTGDKHYNVRLDAEKAYILSSDALSSATLTVSLELDGEIVAESDGFYRLGSRDQYLINPQRNKEGEYAITLFDAANEIVVSEVAGHYRSSATADLELVGGFTDSGSDGANINGIAFNAKIEEPNDPNSATDYALALVDSRALADHHAINFDDFVDDGSYSIAKGKITFIRNLKAEKVLAGYNIDGYNGDPDLLVKEETATGSTFRLLRDGLLDGSNAIDFNDETATYTNTADIPDDFTAENVLTMTSSTSISNFGAGHLFNGSSTYQDMYFQIGTSLKLISSSSIFGDGKIWDEDKTDVLTVPIINLDSLASITLDVREENEDDSTKTVTTQETIDPQSATITGIADNKYTFIDGDGDDVSDILALDTGSNAAYVAYGKTISGGDTVAMGAAYVEGKIDTNPDVRDPKYKGFKIEGLDGYSKVYSGGGDDDVIFAGSGKVLLLHGDKLRDHSEDWNGLVQKTVNIGNLGIAGKQEREDKLGVILTSSETGFGNDARKIEYGRIDNDSTEDIVIELDNKLWIIYGDDLQSEVLDRTKHSVALTDDWVKQHGVVVSGYANTTMDFSVMQADSASSGGILFTDTAKPNEVLRLNSSIFSDSGELDLTNLSFIPDLS